MFLCCFMGSVFAAEQNNYRVFSDPTAPPRKVAPQGEEGQAGQKNEEEVLDANGQPQLRLKIDAIVISKKRTFALVAGSKIHVGDEYRGYLVTAIRPNEVVLSKDKKEHVFYLIEDVI